MPPRADQNLSSRQNFYATAQEGSEVSDLRGHLLFDGVGFLARVRSSPFRWGRLSRQSKRTSRKQGSEHTRAFALIPDAWSASGLNDSCGSDVGAELLPELTDNSGTTRGTKLSVLQMMPFSMFGSIVALDR